MSQVQCIWTVRGYQHPANSPLKVPTKSGVSWLAYLLEYQKFDSGGTINFAALWKELLTSPIIKPRIPKEAPKRHC